MPVEIKKEMNGTVLTVSLAGKLNAIAARELNSALADIDDVKELIFDFAELTYIASIGLRSLFVLQKRMNKQGKMKLKHVRREIKDIFEMTGFIDFFTIEN